MTSNGTTSSAQVARQHLQTSQLLGIDFLPLRATGAPSAVEVKPISADPQAAFAAPPPPIDWITAAGDQTRQIKAKALLELMQRHDAGCPHCTSVTYHTRTVFGEGDPVTRLMFIGEAPGEDEDRTGRPFVGRAGQKLDDIIKAMGLARTQVFIANVLKSRPPNNRTPVPAEVEKCAPFLAEQIAIIRPAVIVSLGNPATQFLLRTTLGITRLRGTWQTYTDSNRDFTVPVMPTFHPSYILRNYTAETRGMVWSDMQAVMASLKNFSQSGIRPLESRG